ncbi:MAG: site-specific DNA-methyltransferase [Eubacteriales bacterium]|nr:site-specific DNA-methyltransferase [Eubacteriales bacterium]
MDTVPFLPPDASKISSFPLDCRNQADGLTLLSTVSNACIAAAFFDPQYRGVLDKLSYGNEGIGRGMGRCGLPQMSHETILSFLAELDRVLVPSGHLFLWVDKFHLCEDVSSWFAGTDLSIVDMITWNKQKMGMGYRTRRMAEYLLVLQKQPRRAKGCWMNHSIPDVWTEKVKKSHAHSKPIELQKELIRATTHEGDTVLDPAAGGYSVLFACAATNRRFLGCDIIDEG